MDYEKKYKETLKKIENLRGYSLECNNMIDELFPELKESEDEKIKKAIVKMISDIDGGFPFEKHGIIKKKALAWLESQGEKQDYNPYKATIESIAAMVERYANGDLKDFYDNVKVKCKDAIEYDNTWLEKQGDQKEINLVEILKHYPRETELYSPLYGKLWLAEVDEEHEIITCYKHQLDEGCVRAILEQEDTVSFYSNGTTGLPDFTISKDCMLFLYDIEKQGEQNPVWSEDDEKIFNEIFSVVEKAFSRKCTLFGESYDYIKWKNWLKSLKPHWKPNDEQMQSLYFAIITYSKKDDCKFTYDGLNSLYDDLKKL